MTAKEARDKSQVNLEMKTQEAYKDVLKEINVAVSKGEFQTTYYKALKDSVIEFLEKEGYKVKYRDGGRNDYYYTINW